eukprot:Skav233484  [mRNA]  locus=scaffold1310:149215:150049:+ [translate_table: standard]
MSGNAWKAFVVQNGFLKLSTCAAATLRLPFLPCAELGLPGPGHLQPAKLESLGSASPGAHWTAACGRALQTFMSSRPADKTVVSRAEFEALRAELVQCRATITALTARVVALEGGSDFEVVTPLITAAPEPSAAAAAEHLPAEWLTLGSGLPKLFKGNAEDLLGARRLRSNPGST